MDVYKKIVKSIKDHLVSEGKVEEAKMVKPILDKYLQYTCDALFHNMRVSIHSKGLFKVKMYPLIYISKMISKGGLYSSLSPNWIFKISLAWDTMKKHEFTFKPMKEMGIRFKRTTLDTPYIYKLIEAHEKNIV